MKISIDKNIIHLDDKQIEFESNIDTVKKIHNRIIIRLMYSSIKLENASFFRNIICLDKKGNILWRAPLPTDNPMDYYCNIYSFWPQIKASSFSNYMCKINIKNGEIVSKSFTKT